MAFLAMKSIIHRDCKTMKSQDSAPGDHKVIRLKELKPGMED